MPSRTLALVLLAILVGSTGCAQVRLIEGIGKTREEGTLILAEGAVALTREQTLEKFSSADLHAAGLGEADIRDGSAIFATPFKQRGTFEGVFALVPRHTVLDIRKTCNANNCIYGGDVVAVRLVRNVSREKPALHIVDAVVEPFTAQGDCYYVLRGSRRALHCKSLGPGGWEWDDDVFVKRPGTPTSR